MGDLLRFRVYQYNKLIVGTSILLSIPYLFYPSRMSKPNSIAGSKRTILPNPVPRSATALTAMSRNGTLSTLPFLAAFGIRLEPLDKGAEGGCAPFEMARHVDQPLAVGEGLLDGRPEKCRHAPARRRAAW